MWPFSSPYAMVMWFAVESGRECRCLELERSAMRCLDGHELYDVIRLIDNCSVLDAVAARIQPLK